MVTHHQLAWLKEFLLQRCETDADRESALEIVDAFDKLWTVARAGRRFRDFRTNECLTAFCEALEALKTSNK